MERLHFSQAARLAGSLLLILTTVPSASAASSRPNVLLIVADDLGFSDLGCYGSEIETPHLDRLAEHGLRLTQFTTTSRCCPSRASILTGHYPHRVGLGHMTKDIHRPGYRGRVSPDVKTIAQRLASRGYRSFLSGKWHLGTDDPTRHGFEEFYGTLVSAKTFWERDHFLRVSPRQDRGLPPDDGSGRVSTPFYGTDALGDHALQFLTQARTTPERPWFLYLAFNAPHFPLHAPKSDIAKYAERYHAGWDALRAERLANMKRLGIVPPETELSPRSHYYDWAAAEGEPNPAWDSLPNDRRADLARRMAIYAAMVDRMDQNVGRVLADLEAAGELDNTLIIFTSDNGACAEWDAFGFDIKSGPRNILHAGDQLAEMGTPGTFHSVGSGWANASNTPWRLYKHFNHEGGIAVPCIVHWPARMEREPGSIDSTPTHLIDLVPTLLDAADTTGDAKDNDLPGTSLLPLLTGEELPERTLFFEHEGNRAVRDGTWKLVALRDRPWELYDMVTDRTETQNLASEHPEVVERLAKKWDAWAEANHVTPLPDDYEVEYLPVSSRDDDSAAKTLAEIFTARGFSMDDVRVPSPSDPFPMQKLKRVRFESIAKFDWFPEGPSYRAADGSYFFAGKHALTRVDSAGKLHSVLREPGGGGTHVLPDGSMLIVGHVGLRRLYPDGRVELLADGNKTGAGNDLSVGIHGEVYFSVPKEGIYRLTPGADGRLVRVSTDSANGLEVDPAGKFLYVAGRTVRRYPLDITSDSLGTPQTVFTFAPEDRGGDGCAFDAYGNFYTVHFRTGTLRVIDPERKRLLAKIPIGVVPATNLTFGGPHNTDLFVTAGAPKAGNCQVLKAEFGVTGFCGHVGATDYPAIGEHPVRGDADVFAAPDRN